MLLDFMQCTRNLRDTREIQRENAENVDHCYSHSVYERGRETLDNESQIIMDTRSHY